MVRSFQQKHGLLDDGIVGPKTAKAMKKAFCIPNNEYAAHFLGQSSWESSGFTRGRENMNYSADGLLLTFSIYFTPETAKLYARKPKKIGNRVYANRMGNGNEASGDGYFNRGAGAIQTTGKNNIAAFAEAMNDPCIIKDPNLIVKQYYFESALFFFNRNNLWQLCAKVDNASILTVSRAINLGNPNSRHLPNHLQERRAETNKYYKWLCN